MRHPIPAGRRLASATLATLALFAWSASLGCGGGDDASPGAPEAPAASDAPADASEASLRNREAVSFGELPSSFPSDLPTYPNSKPDTSLAVPGGGLLATFDSADDAPTISAHFQKELATHGWNVTKAAPNEVVATKEGRNVRITIDEQADGPTRIAIGTTTES